METFSFIDIYATKGIEYLIVITFLVSLVVFHKYFVHAKNEAGAQRAGFFSFLRETFGVKAYLGEMRWNPVMSYMKHPAEKQDAEKSDDKEARKDPQ